MGMESFVAASDLHGDRQDKAATAIFKKFVGQFKPKFRVFLGDIFDFRAIRVGADREEKMHSMKQDFAAGMEFLEWFRPHVILLGNHDQRLYDIVEKDGLRKTGPLVDYAEDLIAEFESATKKLGTTVLPYDKRRGVFQRSGLKFVHGSDGMDPDNMANVYGDVLYGHGHAIDRSSPPTSENVRTARMVGCLCQLDMTYNRAQTKTLRQQHGWAYGVFLGPRKHAVDQATITDGQLVYADRFNVITA